MFCFVFLLDLPSLPTTINAWHCDKRASKSCGPGNHNVQRKKKNPKIFMSFLIHTRAPFSQHLNLHDLRPQAPVRLSVWLAAPWGGMRDSVARAPVTARLQAAAQLHVSPADRQNITQRDAETARHTDSWTAGRAEDFPNECKEIFRDPS